METSSLFRHKLDLLCFMGRQGIRYPKHKMHDVHDYMNRMIEAERIIVINDEQGIHTTIMFSLCEESEPFLKKRTWEYREHNPEGTTFYIEKAVSRGWTRELRNQFKELLLRKFPQLTIAQGHRWGSHGDRLLKCRRRYVPNKNT